MRTKYTLFGMLVALLLVQACSESKFDYRYKYVGDYDAQVTFTQPMWGNSPSAFEVPAKVNVDFGNAADALDLTVSPDTTWPFVFLFTLPLTIDHDLTLHSATDTSFSGRFLDKRNLEFEFLQFPADPEHTTWHVKASRP